MKTALKFLAAMLFLLVPTQVFAFNAESRTDQKFDGTLSDQTSTVYTTPTKIYVSQITTQSAELEKDPSLWVQSLYYYSITKLHFADIPYNYIVDSNGIIYQGRSGGIGANPEMKDATTGVILIGYLSNDSDLTNRASTSIYSLVDTLASQWGISSISTVKLSISQQDSQLSKLVPTVINDDFAQSVSTMMGNWAGYTTEKLTYQAKVESVTYDKDVEVASKLHVTVQVKNMNDFVWLTDKNPIYVSTASNADSAYAINGVWDSFSKPTHVSNKAVLPGDSVTFEFDLLAQVAPGSASEKFQIEKSDSSPFTDSQFSVDFNIIKGDKSLVQVDSSQYGFVNVRECQWYSCKVIDSVNNGTVYILLSETDDGWMEIQYNPDTVGWVYAKYMKKI
jgi:hypothetical protein